MLEGVEIHNMQLLFSFLVSVSLLLYYFYYQRVLKRVSPTIPYVGEESLLARLKAAGDYNLNTVKFLVEQRKKLGDVFCVDLIILKIVFFLGAEGDRKSTRLNSSHSGESRMPSSA